MCKNPNTPKMYRHDGCIVLSYIARNGVVLAEARKAGYHQYSKFVTETARRLQQKAATPGWEFAKLPTLTTSCPLRLHGAKFHIQEHHPEEEGGFCTWSVGCVYDADAVEGSSSLRTMKMTAPTPVQSFVRHVVRESKAFRQDDDVWKRGGELAAQHHFAPVLADIMQNPKWHDQKAERLQQIDELKDVMHSNIEMLLENGEKEEGMLEKAEELKEQASMFKKRSTKLKKSMKRKHLKMVALYGFGSGCVLTAAVVTPTILLLV